MRSALGKTGKGFLISSAACLIALALAVLPFAATVQAAPGEWEKTRPDNIENDMRDTFYLPVPSQDIGWSVGYAYFTGGAIYHGWFTQDGGTTWSPQAMGNFMAHPSLMAARFESVYFRSQSLGWACGDYGFISRCTDGAAGAWSIVRSGLRDEVLNDVFATTDDDVWAVGTNVSNPMRPVPIVLKSGDGGLTWKTLDVADISFAGADHGWGVGPAGTIVHTNDSGSSWAVQPSTTVEDLNAVYAVSQSEAWAAGSSGVILHTVDAGSTWQSDFGAGAVFALDENNVWVAGKSGLMMKYDGTRWVRQALFAPGVTPADINSVFFVDAAYGWAAGTDCTFYTTDSGQTWIQGPALPVPGDLSDVFIYHGAGQYHVWTCGEGGRVFITSDADPGGAPAAWAVPSTPLPASDCQGIAFKDASIGAAVGSNGLCAVTDDGGDTWTQSVTSGGTNFTEVEYAGAGDKWVATAEDGAVWMTTAVDPDGFAPVAFNDVSATADGEPEHYVGNSGVIASRDGSAWTVENSGVSTDLNAVKFFDRDHGWATGDGGRVLCTADGGATWIAIDSVVVADWRDIVVKPSDGSTYLVVVVGDGGNINYATMENPPVEPPVWNSPASKPGVVLDLAGVDFYNDDVGWTVGESGAVWQTLNGGADWGVAHFNDVATVDGNHTFFVGDGGAIVHWVPAFQLFEVCYDPTGWTTSDFNSIDFFGTIGLAVGDEGTTAYCTDVNTGAWEVSTVGGVNPDLNCVDMTSPATAVAVGGDGYFARYSGAWEAPEQIPGAESLDFNSVGMSGLFDGYAVADAGYYVSMSAGSWGAPSQVGGVNPDLNAVWLTGADAGYAVGDDGYYVHLDAGAWEPPAQVGGENPDLNDIQYPEQTYGWAVGGDGTTGYRVPVDEGVFGEPESMGAGTRDLTGVSVYPDSETAFASGLFMTVASCDVTGSGWAVDGEMPSTAGDLNAISVEDGMQRGWAVGDGGAVYRMRGGVPTQRPSSTTDDLNDVSTAGANDATAAGDGSRVIQYDGAWSGFTQPSEQDYYAVVDLGDYTTVAGAMNVVFNTLGGGGWSSLSIVYKTTDDFRSVDYIDAERGWFCGQGGIMYRVDNACFLPVIGGVASDLECVSMFGLSEGFACGADRVVLEGSPGGWSKRSGYVAATRLNGVTFPAAGSGWFAGTSESGGDDVGFILKYDNGAFVEQGVPAMNREFNAVSFIEADGDYNGIVVGMEGTAWRTDDSGESWASGLGQPGVDLNGVDWINEDNAVLCGDYAGGDVGTVSFTTNGGYNWDAALTPPPMDGNHQDLTDVSFGDQVNDSGWVVGTGGALFRSDSPDPGQTWVALDSRTAANLNAIDARYDVPSSDYMLFAAGDSRTITRSADGGASWQTRSGVPAPSSLNAGGAGDASGLYFCGELGDRACIIRTPDAGVTFSSVNLGGSYPPLYGLCVENDNMVWAAGYATSPAESVVLHWNGISLTPQEGLAPDAFPRDVSIESNGLGGFPGVFTGMGGRSYYCLDANAGPWVPAAANVNRINTYSCDFKYGAGPGTAHYVGDGGSLLVSTDGGSALAFQRGPATHLNSVSFYDGTNGWACGAQGTILATADGGATWTPQDSGTTADLNGIFATGADSAWAVGSAGTVLVWDGSAWSGNSPGGSVDYYGVCASDATHAWVVGDAEGEACTVKHFDGAWHDQAAGTENLRAVTISDPVNFWAVGENGAVLRGNGDLWTSVDTGVDANLTSVSAVGADLVWACGDSGTVIHSENAGTNWTSQDTGDEEGRKADLNGIKFMDPANGWAAGKSILGMDPALIVRTTDGGLTWAAQNSNTDGNRTLWGIDGKPDGAGNYAMYSVGEFGTAQRLLNPTALPVITPPLNPDSGYSGPPAGPTAVTITGSGFGVDQETAGGHVYFNGNIEAAVTSWEDTSIVVTVPATAYGFNKDVRVVTDGGGSNVVPFTTYINVVSATTPISGGDTCTVTGTGFGPDPGPGKRTTAADNVTIGTMIPEDSFTSWSETQITFTVPDDLAPGTEQLQVRRGGCVAGTEVEVRPAITDMSPASGTPGVTKVTLTGVNFGVNPGVNWDNDNCIKMQEMDPETGAVTSAPIPSEFLESWNNTTVTFTIPDSGFNPWTGAVSVRREGCESSVDNPSLSVLPLVTDATESGTVGSEATITGLAFGNTEPVAPGGAFFNGVAADVTEWKYNEIKVLVPETVTGAVLVKTQYGDSNAGVFFSVVPEVTGLTPAQGRAGDRITVTGTGFGSTKYANSSIKFNDQAAATTAWAANSITATVPDAARNGDVVVETAGGSSAVSADTKFLVLPKITSISPVHVVPGQTEITIDGFAFGETQAASTVSFNGKNAAKATSWSDTKIKVKAPAGITSGDVMVTRAGPDGGPSNGFAFSVGPNIESISPTQGPPTCVVTVTGTNFKNERGNGKVRFNGVDAQIVSWSDTVIRAKVPYGAATGPVTVMTAEGESAGPVFSVGLSSVYYFAEGTTRPNFEQWLCLMNPNGRDAAVGITYMKGDGTTQQQQLVVKPNSRSTVFVPDVIGPGHDVSTKVEANVPIMAERPMYFNYGGAWDGGHDVVGAIAPQQDWYFAEGNTRDGFEQWFCLQNPGSKKASARITYMLSGGETKVQEVEIPATSRKTIDVKGFLGPNKDCSAQVHSDEGIIAERPMYFIYQPDTKKWKGGHDVLGANAPGTEWFFAEGTTREGFDEWLCLQNPGEVTATATINYMLSSGAQLTQIVTVDPLSRRTVDVASFAGRGHDVSVHIVCDRPIVAERPMYFNFQGMAGGSNVVGSPCSSSNWYFAEGTTHGGFQQWLSVQNPGDAAVTIRVTFMLDTGDPINKDVVVGAHSRTTIDVNSEIGPAHDVSTRVTSTGKVIVERPMYFNVHGWVGGHDVIGFHF